MYSDQVLDHFAHPRNSGAMDAPSASARVENPVCGDVLELALRVEDGVVEEICFLAKGCVAAVACGSALSLLAQHKTLADAKAISQYQLLASLGGLPPQSHHACHLAIDALRAALAQIKL